MADDDGWMDETVAPFRFLVESLSPTAEAMIGPPLDADMRAEGMYIAAIAVSLPFELDMLVETDGTVRLASTAPTQYTRTSVLPVFHQLAMHVTGTRRDG